ncbi:alpha-glucan family phosphorylase [Aerosticca soli]|uniref:glycogen phosphorylase n=1 Tax=Aerosticca soli TaxID=2010829 RepID=A0A2Z6E6E3_9GAMM|nr:alpha-glucan family phosphorylase [Aerosticca soli]BBD80690.1 glycogen phosphorylase [Aerosticca soli]
MSTLDAFLARTRVAYFSMEIALRAEMHTYSGGLGVLAGDTARSCADLRLPVVFVTLASHEGYLRQEIAADGSQIDHPDPWRVADWATPLDAMVGVAVEGRTVWIRPWLYRLAAADGYEIPVLLLDTRLEHNDPRDRGLTDRLYGGDDAYRLGQEIVLGIGGERLLRALGFEVGIYHLNEGHAALLTAALLKRHPHPLEVPAEGQLRYDTEWVREHCVFTTHTPVEAGHDRFDYAMAMRLLGDFLPEDQLKPLAGEDRLNMTRLALNLSGYVNGVAERHAETARKMFPGYVVRAITNGVHAHSWVHPAFANLFQSLAADWAHEPEELVRADQLTDTELWSAHDAAKQDLIDTVARLGGVKLRMDLPILAFARRITGYKRPDLLFSDLARLRALNARHPFQLVIAGKAHPHDEPGKALVHALHAHLRELAGEIPGAFLPDYGLDLARVMVAGADVWLNTPQPPLEASGTSGMKAALNGVLNLSVLDGWWWEGWIEDVTGWGIGASGPASDHANELYDTLEHKVLPRYYQDRARWLGMMRASISKTAPRFNSQRMMRRYAAEAYLR